MGHIHTHCTAGHMRQYDMCYMYIHMRHTTHTTHTGHQLHQSTTFPSANVHLHIRNMTYINMIHMTYINMIHLTHWHVRTMTYIYLNVIWHTYTWYIRHILVTSGISPPHFHPQMYIYMYAIWHTHTTSWAPAASAYHISIRKCAFTCTYYDIHIYMIHTTHTGHQWHQSTTFPCVSSRQSAPPVYIVSLCESTEWSRTERQDQGVEGRQRESEGVVGRGATVNKLTSNRRLIAMACVRCVRIHHMHIVKRRLLDARGCHIDTYHM